MMKRRIPALSFIALLIAAMPHAVMPSGFLVEAAFQDSSAEPPRIRKKDQLDIRVYDACNYPNYKVDDEGMIDFPFTGPVRAEGLTEAELEREIATRLKRYLKNPQVKVRLLRQGDN